MQRNISKIESSHPDIICPPGKSPGAQVKYCSLKCCLPYITYIYFLKYQSSDCLHWVKPEFWLQDPTWGDVWRQHQMCSPLQGIASLAPNIIHCVYLCTEEPFLSFSGGVLPKVWHRPPKVKLQGQRGRFSRSWKEKVWNHFHWCIPLQLCVSWYDSPLNSQQSTPEHWLIPPISQILPEKGPRQRQLGCNQIVSFVHLKQERPWGGRGVHRCLFWSHSNPTR